MSTSHTQAHRTSQSQYFVPEAMPNNFWSGCSFYQNAQYTPTYNHANAIQNSRSNGTYETPIVKGVCPIGPMAPRGPFRSENS